MNCKICGNHRRPPYAEYLNEAGLLLASHVEVYRAVQEEKFDMCFECCEYQAKYNETLQNEKTFTIFQWNK